MYKYNYHTHTFRCGHALGSDESFVLGAIELGIKKLGFSDHVSFPDLYFKGMRQNRSELDDYIASINFLKNKYKDKIDIHIGFEAEYIEEYIDDYKKLLSTNKIEYLICGQHCYIENKEQKFYNSYYHSEEMVVKYVDAVIKAMQSGLFLYIAHPDHFMNGYREWDDVAIRESKRLIEASIKYNVPLEINAAGIRFAFYKHRKNQDGRPIENLYPFPQFWDLVSEYKAKAVIGIDAHRKEDFLDEAVLEAYNFALEHNVSLLDDLDV